MHTRRAVFPVVIALILTTALLPAAADEVPDDAVATVNGEAISIEQLQAEAIARYGPQVLQHLIIGSAIEQAAEEAGVEVMQKEIEQRVMSAEERIEWKAPLTGVNFAKWLASNNLTPASFRQKVYHTMLLEKMVEDQVNVTDQQVADYYSRTREQLHQPERVKVAHIVLPDADTAQDVRDKIITEKLTFEQAAAKHSLDRWTKDEGGEWGYVGAGESPFQQAAMKLQEDGDISPPVQSPMGFHILKRLDKREAGIPPYEDIKDEIKSQMENQRLHRLTNQKRLEILQDAQVQRLIQFNANGTYTLPGDEAETETQQ